MTNMEIERILFRPWRDEDAETLYKYASDPEVAPRTQHLMTDGPYRLNRNPMLTGTLLYLAGVVVWLWNWQAAAVWVAFLAVMLVQVVSEERRLSRDFGEEYDAYRRRTRRF